MVEVVSTSKIRTPNAGQRNRKNQSTDDSSDLQGKIKGCVQCIVEVFEFAGFDSKGYNREGTIKWHVECVKAMGGDWLKFFKYKLAAFYAAFEGQKLPPSPLPDSLKESDHPDTILGGKAGKWFKMWERTDREKAQEIALGVFMSKKGFPKPDVLQIAAAVEKTFVKLTTKRPDATGKYLIHWGDVNKGIDDRIHLIAQKDYLKEEIRRTVKELANGRKYTIEDQMKAFFPSTNANYNNSRSNAGTMGEIFSIQGLREGLMSKEPIILWGQEKASSSIFVDTSGLQWRWDQIMHRMETLAEREPPIAVPLGLAEALKVRVISKGPPMLYAILKPLQKFLWKMVKECKAAKLIGETISEEYLCEMLGKCREGEEYVSIDYSDATNEMFAWVSEEVADSLQLELGLSEKTTKFLKQSLTGHIIENPVTGEWAFQKEAQLMGSITSFPILCIVCLTIMRWSIEVDRQRTYSLDRMPAVDNGDDGVMRGSKRLHDIWVPIAATAGLSPSIGKVYCSNRFLNMNSTLFNVVADYVRRPKMRTVHVPQSQIPEVELEHSPGKVYYDQNINRIIERRIVIIPKDPQVLFLRKKKYVNLGLLHGQTRSETGKLTEAKMTDLGLPESLGKIAEYLLETSPPGSREKVYKAFLNRHWKQLTRKIAKPKKGQKAQGQLLPWFLPEHLGGLGLPAFGKFQPSKENLRLASAIHSHFTIPKRKPVRDWRVWDYVTREQPELRSLHAAYESVGRSTKTLEDLQGLLCVEAIFRVDSISELYQEPQVKVMGPKGKPVFKTATDEQRTQLKKEQTAKHLRAVEKIVIKAHKRMADVEPFTLGKLPMDLRHDQPSNLIMLGTVSSHSPGIQTL